MSSLVEIYALSDPVTGEVRYIGKANDSRKRLASHMRDARRRDTPLYRWIRKLQSQSLFPDISVLTTVPESEWQATERRFIAEYRKTTRLLNIADGGDQPCCPHHVLVANARRIAANIQADPQKKRWWYVTKSLSSQLAREAKKRPGEYFHKKLVLNCMALADVLPNKVPSSWHTLRWDEAIMGTLDLSVIEKHMSPALLSRMDFTGVFA